MALKKLDGMIWGRFITLVLLIAIPLFYVLLIVGSLDQLLWFDPAIITYKHFTHLGPVSWGISFMSVTWAKVFAYGFLPVFFSLPWVVFLFIDRNRVAETFDNMGRAMRKVSLGLNLFYSISALIVFIFFVLPFGSPIIGVFASFGLIPWIIKKKTGRKLPLWLVLIPSLLLSAIPIVLAIGFCTNYADIWANLWSFWSGTGSGSVLQQLGFAHYMWGFGYSVAIGAVFAGFANFVYEGASYMDHFTKKPKGFLYIVEFVVAAVVFTLYMIFPVSENVGEIMFYIISGLAIFVGLMEFVMRFFRKRRRSDRDNVPIGALVMLPLFIAVDLVRLAGDNVVRNAAITAALGLVCVVYMVLFLMAYSFAGETYKSRWSKGYGDDDDEDDDDEDTSDED
ncbi:MAG: hypothetical protein KGD59_00710 [Candidatus Heimdallarchaeota archaeon]|jgi:hypothetical protein|nr:hypothetical protein [Candidatus Heimdallarchaeota archaeon]